MQFGPIWIEQQARDPAPPLRHRIEDAAQRRDGEQRPEDLRFQEWMHFNVSWGGPTTQFCPLDQMPVMLVSAERGLHSTQVDRPDVFVEQTPTYVDASRRVDRSLRCHEDDGSR